MNDQSDVALRDETADDKAFLFELFRQTRLLCEHLHGIDADLTERLLRHQFEGRLAAYRVAHPDALFRIVECGGRAIGRLVIDYGAEIWSLIDLALVQEWQGHGLGTRLIAHELKAAKAADIQVQLMVVRDNHRARRFYGRFGFSTVEESPSHCRMLWHPPSVS